MCICSQPSSWPRSITTMFITYTSLYLTHSLLFCDSQLFHFVETNLLHFWSKILAFFFSRPARAHQTRSLCSSIPPLHSLIHRRLLCQWQSTFPPPPHLMDSHLHGKHWVHFLWDARIGEEEWILKPRTGNIWLILPPNNVTFRQGGASEWPGWKSIKSKFAQFWPTTGSCFDFPQANFIYLYNLTGPIFGYVAVIIFNKTSTT